MLKQCNIMHLPHGVCACERERQTDRKSDWVGRREIEREENREM